MFRVKKINIRTRLTSAESGDAMGLTHTAVRVTNPADKGRVWEEQFLVDTGAIDSMAPAAALRSIGLEPEGERSYVLADGTELRMGICVARLEFMDELVGATLIFGPDNCEPLLGVTALESIGLVVDPETQQLKRLPAIPLKGSRSG